MRAWRYLLGEGTYRVPRYLWFSMWVVLVTNAFEGLLILAAWLAS